MAVHPARKDTGLRANCLSAPEVLAQSIANIAPAAMPSVTIPLVFASAGNGTWLTFVIATVGLVLVGININQFARRSAYPGSLYGSISRTLGPAIGILSGWSLILAYLFTAMTVSCGFVIYATTVLNELGLQAPTILLFAVCIGAVWYYAYTDIQLSAVLMLIFETLSVSLILILALLVLGKQGFPIDGAQLTLQDVSPEGLRLGLILAIFSYVGFESATALGEEAKHPLYSIPRAVIASTIIAGSFYILMSYVEVLGFTNAPTPLNETPIPLSFLANQAGVGLLGVGISVGITFSFFTCALASVNAGARIAFSLARHKIFHASLGNAHRQNETPHNAVTLSAILVFIVPTSLSMFGLPVLRLYDYLGTLATFGFLLVYILISIAAVVERRRKGTLQRRHLVIAGLAVVLMLIPVLGSIYPVPEFPLNILPYLFLLYLAAGWWFFLRLNRRSPQKIQHMERDLEVEHNRFTG